MVSSHSTFLEGLGRVEEDRPGEPQQEVGQLWLSESQEVCLVRDGAWVHLPGQLIPSYCDLKQGDLPSPELKLALL